MKKVLKKLSSILLVLAFSVSMLAACGNEAKDTVNTPDTVTDVPESTDAPDATATPVPTEEPAVDLGGIDIIIGDWWSAEEPAEPTNAREEATQEYREMIQKKYNFTMKQIGITDWYGMQETFTTTTVAEDPAASIFLLQTDWIEQPLSNGLMYDLATLEEFDFTEDKWNSSVRDIMTYGDSIYGMAEGKPEPRIGVFWNKRLFQEAGLDPDLPYDLQASGEWTWEKFEELCVKLNIDSNNDGTIDSYATGSFSVDFYRGAVASNNARFIGKDENNKFYNATLEPNFLEAVQWATSIVQKGYEMPAPPDSNWDWFIAAFHDAKVAMTFAEQYKVSNWADMTDDWGFVLCPKGPKASSYGAYYFDNIAVMPSCLDPETAKKVAFAYNLWTDPTPGYEDDEEGWKDNYYTRFRDERAVDETLTMLYDPSTLISDERLPFVYGTSFGQIIYNVYALANTPAERIETIAGMWEALLEDANN
jgi:hypothetical protein